MKTIKMYHLILLSSLALASCEGNAVNGYTNAGLTEAEEKRTRNLIDSSLIKLRIELHEGDSLADGLLKMEIAKLREEIEILKKKK
jgi:hypothetical protein